MKFFIFIALIVLCICSDDFGKNAKIKYFQLAPDEIYINHGSYGAPLKVALESQAKYLRQMELNPLRFMAHEFLGLVNGTLARLSKYIGADKEDIVMIENASSGVNGVLRSWQYQRGDKILVTSLGYNAVKETIQFLVDQFGVELVTVPIVLPTNREMIVKAVREAVSGNTIKYAVLDHISSFPSIELPIKELIAIMREKNIPTLIDAAHALGQVKINLKDLDPDYYLGNGHKWLCSSHGSAFLYVKRSLQSRTHPSVISHFYKLGFQQSFAWIGTRDYSSMFTMVAALDFREKFGEDRIIDHNNRLCRTAADFMFKRWNTTTIGPLEMMNSMINIRIPCNVQTPDCYNYKIEEIQKKLEDQNIWTFLRNVDGVNYIRISCQIYNEIAEFEKFVQVFEELTK